MTPTELIAWREAIGGRRFLMTMGAHFINTTLFLFQRLSEQGYLTTFSATVGMYLLAEAHQKYVESKLGQVPTVKPPPGVDSAA